MGTSSPNNILLIWLDKNYDKSKENKEYQNELRSIGNIELECFDDLNKGIDFIKKIRFRKTIIIVSGSFYPKFNNLFQKIVDDIYIIPKIIVFTKSKEYISEDKTLPINDPFYNSGGVVDDFDELKEIIQKSKCLYNLEYNGNKKDIFQKEELKFQKISNKKELVLPIYYGKHLKKFTEKELKKIFKKIIEEKEDKDNTLIQFLFSQISESGNIPNNIFIKFWLRAYSAHSSFNKKMNEKLINKEYNDYLPIIQKLYETVNGLFFETDDSKLYKGIIVAKNDDSENNWDNFVSTFEEKTDNIPTAILYCTSFCSFFKDEDKVKEFKNNNKIKLMRHNYFIKLILEKNNNHIFVKNNANITKELSYFNSDDEIVFFPFSCFEIKKIEKKEKDECDELIITLNYLDDYKNLFKENEFGNNEIIPVNDFSKIMLDSGLINKSIKLSDLLNLNQNEPNQINEQNNSIGQNLQNQDYNNNPNNLYQNQNMIYNNLNNQFINGQNNLNNYNFNNPPNNLNQNQNYQNYQYNQGNNAPNFNNQQNYGLIQGMNNNDIISTIKNICIYTINQGVYNNFEGLNNLIRNNISQNIPGNWWVNVSNQPLNMFGNIDPNSVNGFQYNNYFIYFAPISE